MTRLLGRADIERPLDIPAALELLADGFRRVDEVPIPGRRVRTDLPGPGTATALLPGLLPGVPAYTVKVNAKFPGADPALRGIVCLHDLGSGRLLALLDSATITSWRTGISAALATHALASEGAGDTLGVIGAGSQASFVLRGLRSLRPIDEVVINDLSADAAHRFSAWAEGIGIRAHIVSEPAEVAARASTLVVATWSRTPLLGSTDARPGHHITSLGADEPGKQELTASLLESATLFVDDPELVSAMGAIANAGLGRDAVAATLGDVLGEELPGRMHEDEVTVYAPVGMPWQDLSLAWLVYARASKERTGGSFDFLDPEGRGEDDKQENGKGP